MKVAFYVLVATCLINGFSAADLSAFEEGFNLESDFDETLIQNDDNVKILWPTTEDPSWTRPTTTTTQKTTTEPETTTSTTTTTTQKPRPTRPPRPTPTPTPTTTTTTTTTSAPTTTTRRPRPTRPPRPSTTSLRPRPPKRSSPAPLPVVKRPQIYNNRVNALKPFASNLVNVVRNEGGKQRTIQKNQIFYNIRNRPAPRLMNEEEPIF